MNEDNNNLPNNQTPNNQNFNQHPINSETPQLINISPKKKQNSSLIKSLILIVGIIIIGITFGMKLLNKNDDNFKKNDNESNVTDINDNSNINSNYENDEESNRFFSINDTITTKNNYFEYNNYKWEFIFEDTDGVSIWQGTIKNISNQNLKGNLRLKFYDNNNKVIGDVQKHKFDKKIDPSDVFVLEPGEKSNMSFTFYSKELYEGYNLEDVKYISVEDIK